MRMGFLQNAPQLLHQLYRRGVGGEWKAYKKALQPPSSSTPPDSFRFLASHSLRPSIDRKAMSGEAEISFSGTSTAVYVCPGVAEAPREAGACAAREEEEVASHSALAKGISRLAAISGPAAQEEARVRALRRA